MKAIVFVFMMCGFSLAFANNKDIENHVNCITSYKLGDYKKAIDICEKLTEMRVHGQISNYVLGEIYSYGKGVKKNEQKALKYYLRSAEWGYPPAMLVIGHHFSNDMETIEDAIKWYVSAGEVDWDGAGYALSRAGDLLLNIERFYDSYKYYYASQQKGYTVDTSVVEGKLSVDEIAKAKKDVGEWIHRNRIKRSE